jgi:hypothetical protein
MVKLASYFLSRYRRNQDEEFKQKHAKIAKVAASSTPHPQIIFGIQTQSWCAAGVVISIFAVFASFCSNSFSFNL